MTFVDVAEKKKEAIYAIYLLVATSFLTNSKTYTLNVWTEKLNDFGAFI